MATFQFLGSGDPIEAFNINNILVNKPLLYAEVRLRKDFPYPTLEAWRRSALQFTATPTPTGTSAIGTQARTTLLYAHEADLGPIFYELVGTSPTDLEGYYVDKRKAVEVDRLTSTVRQLQAAAIREMVQLKVPEQVITLLTDRLTSPSFNHRVPGMCAAVYLAAILLYQAELTP